MLLLLLRHLELFLDSLCSFQIGLFRVIGPRRQPAAQPPINPPDADADAADNPDGTRVNLFGPKLGSHGITENVLSHLILPFYFAEVTAIKTQIFTICISFSFQ